MPRPVAPEPFVAHLSRLPRSLDADLRRVAAVEGVSMAQLERMFLRTMIAMYDQERIDLGAVRAEGD